MLRTVIIGLLAIISVVIILVSLMMEPKSEGAGATYGQSSGAFGSTAHQAKEKLLQKVMIFSGAVAAICLIALIVL